jgi:nucleotide-binding universal stress UspA family protein
MSTVTTAHVCPRCELRFAQPVELRDHLLRDHPAPEEPEPAPAGRVVLAVDPGRADPGVAVETAARMAGQLGAALEIVAATAPGFGHDVTEACLQERSRESHHAGARWISWHDLGDRPPAEAVADHAGDSPHTWLCLASRARTAVGEKVFGSVAGEVLGRSKVPVLVVGPRVERASSYTRVVACVDRSPAAPRVVAAAAELADRLESGLVALEVSMPDAAGAPLDDDGHLRALVGHLHQDVTTVVLAGDRIWAHILRFVEDDPGTVLVTGRRPLSAAGRFAYGSVAVNLARKAHGPVMIVPNPHEEA